MARKKQVRKRTRKRTGNTLVFKLIDPILQSFLFVFFIYCLDTDSQFSYKMVLLILLGLQLLSLAVNFFVKTEEQLKKERLAYLVSILAYLAIAFFAERFSNGNITNLFMESGRSGTVTYILMAGLLGMAFWYFTICFREVREMLTSQHSDND